MPARKFHWRNSYGHRHWQEKKDNYMERVKVRPKGGEKMWKNVALFLNDSQGFLKCGSVVLEKTTPDTKGPLKCFLKCNAILAGIKDNYFQRLLIISEQTTFKPMTFDFLYHAFVSSYIIQLNYYIKSKSHKWLIFKIDLVVYTFLFILGISSLRICSLQAFPHKVF